MEILISCMLNPSMNGLTARDLLRSKTPTDPLPGVTTRNVQSWQH
jgi:hypothetical protein